MRLLIASRQSDLARLQAYQVGDRLTELGHQIQYHFRESLGDINQSDPLWKMPEKGVFTEDFRQGLEEGQWDMVVHSWKDLPIDPLPKTELVATLPRADVRDVFLFKKNHLASVNASGILKVFSSSPRRIYNLSPLLKSTFPAPLQSIEFESVRGNILTRVRKMIEDPNVDGLIVAKAALDRLLSVTREEFLSGQKQLKDLLQHCLFQVLPLSANPTAAAQGALAIEIRKDREDLRKLLCQIHCERSWEEAQKEREILKSYGGGCHQKIGVSCVKNPWGWVTFLRGEAESGEVLRVLGQKELPVKLKNPFPGDWSFFARQDVKRQEPVPVGGHFISRISALPEPWQPCEADVLWASGVKTWAKLAEKGLWVHGCADSLGEDQEVSLGPLFPVEDWYRWTHSLSEPGLGKENKVAYELIPLEKVDDHSSYEEYFWKSGSQFERAVALFPKILQATHFCGPGHTYKKLQQVLKEKGIEKMPIPVAHPSVWKQAVKDFKK